MPAKIKREPRKKRLPSPAAGLSDTALLSVPVNFCTQILGVELYPWQKEILMWFADQEARRKGTVAAPNGSGKSERVIACLALWWVCMSPRATVVITSKDGRQLDEQIWPAIEQHKAKFGGFIWNRRHIETPTGGRIVGFTTDQPGRAEGWHKQPEGPLLIIVDEAKSVEEPIFTAFDRCTFNGLLYISSTGLMQGRFFESQTKDAAQYRRMKVKLEDCPHIDPERIQDVLQSYGEDHPFTRSTLYSEFMSQDGDSNFFFPLPAIDACIESPPRHRPGERVVFCDFAGGGDENVLAVREGNKIRLLKCWRETNEMAAVGEFIRQFKIAGFSSSEIWGDNCGSGKPMIARFHELGWPINRFNAGETAYNDADFCNRGAEIWETAGRMVARGDIIIPDDLTLRAQLSSRKRMVDSRGRIKCESKEDMARRGVKSPDRADAVTGCAVLRTPRVISPGKGDVNPPWVGWIAESHEAANNEPALVGCEMGD